MGSHLAEVLLDEGHTVEVLDDLSTGSLSNIAHLMDRPGFSDTIDTVMDEAVVGDLADRSDIIFHLAAAVGVKLIVEDPVGTIETNVHGTEVVLKQARRGGQRVVIFSTSEVYGKSTAVPFSETADLVMGPTTKHRWAYACSKAMDEFLALAYYKEYQLPVVIVRLFNTVGPRQTGRYGMVVPNLVGQALRGEPLTVFGDGTQTRCFSYVGDIVPALVELVEHPGARGQAVNLGGATEISIGALARRIVALLDSPSEIVLVPYSQAYGEGYEDMRRRVPDNTLAGELIGFTPRTGIDAIIRNVADAMVADVRMAPTTFPTALTA